MRNMIKTEVSKLILLLVVCVSIIAGIKIIGYEMNKHIMIKCEYVQSILETERAKEMNDQYIGHIINKCVGKRVDK